MKTERPPYCVAIWFVLIAGSIAVTIDLVLLLRPVLAPSPTPSILRRNPSPLVLVPGATDHQCGNMLKHANQQL